MLKAAVFDNLKEATTLLLWGDEEGMAALICGFEGLRVGDSDKFAIGGPRGGVTITDGGGSTLTGDGPNLVWRCSREMIKAAADSAKTLINRSGHQYLQVSGRAEQVIIAQGEYPESLR